MELSIKNSINNDKSLCLYCDKSFANHVEQENHVERDHKTILFKGKGSRKSERITKNNLSSENSPFPGCFHCNKKVCRTDDLDILFEHLLTTHKDVYFGCKCKIRTQDKVSLANHKKNCKIGGGGKSTRCSDENLTENRKTAKKSQTIKSNGDSKCDSLSESEDNASSVAASSVTASNSSKTLPANAIHKKSDRSKLENLSKNASVNDKGKKNKSSSCSTISSRSSSTNRTGDDEYTIPLTRQKLKEPPTFSRLGAAQNRSSSNNKKSQKTNKSTPVDNSKTIIAPSPSTKVQRTKTSKSVNASLLSSPEPIESVLKSETVSTEFDEDFYRTVSQNIRSNMAHHIDGKGDRLPNRRMFDHIAEPTSDRTPQFPALENEIHEATNFELSTPFPALLTVEQYGFGDSNLNKNKRQITKNSWKWKWDLIKKYKYVNEGGKIVKKVKQMTQGTKDLSQLDMWTQLSMRSRYEALTQSGATTDFDDGLNEGLSTRMIKTQNIEQLNHILDKCLTPEINIEQLQQTVIKLEPEEREEPSESVQIESETNVAETAQNELLNMINLVKTNTPKPSNPLLSGEWARPRCYICLDCGQKFDLMKSLNDHKNSEHPYVVSSHYEIVGRENLEQKLYKNLFLPKKALQTSGYARILSVNSDSKSNETNEASTSSDNSSKFFADQKEKECSKCLKMIKYSSDTDIYKHILDCIEDRVWMQAKRRSKYRRSRRKNRKTTRKSRLSIDQKKMTSSPSTKDNTEGENSTLSISNPPTPKDDVNISTTVAISAKANKIESLLGENKAVNGKSNESMNIKNFFRVSKASAPVVPQKIVVQMLEIPETNQTSSLRSSLRSSRRSNINARVGSAAKNGKAENKKEAVKSEEVKAEAMCSDENIPKQSVNEKDVNSEETPPSDDIEVINDSLTTPLTIATPEKGSGDFPLCSPSSSSLISPTSNSNVPKKKKKLNDCIAMLTCKIQEKLGVDFFNNAPPELLSPEKVAAAKAKDELTKTEENVPPEKPEPESLTKSEMPADVIQVEAMKEILPELTITIQDKAPSAPSPPIDIKRIAAEVTLVSPISSRKERKSTETKPSTSFQMASILKETFSLPVQEEVIDLSIKKKPSMVEIISTVEKNDLENVEEPITQVAELKNEEIPEMPSDVNSNDKCVEIPVVPIVCEPKVEVVEVVEIIPEEKNEEIAVTVPKELIVETKEEVKEQQAEVKKSQTEMKEPQDGVKPDIEEKVTETLEVFDPEALKVSIPKERIPNLQDILDQYQVITVNNIKISESERRAFEEQKNRILQILNKTNSLTRKIAGRKAPVRKAPKRKAPAKKTAAKKKNAKPEAPARKEPETKEPSVEKKIEEVIKTTNKIRCRRLSVVVDPIISLSAFQNKNRKIRLTNNSQQNGFYDLLTASEQFFTETKITPKPDEGPTKSLEELVAANEVPAVEKCDTLEEPEKTVEPKLPVKTRAAKSIVSKTTNKVKDDTPNELDNLPKVEPEKDVLATVVATVEKAAEKAKEILPETAAEVEKVVIPPKTGRAKKQNVENIEVEVLAHEPDHTENTSPVTVKEPADEVAEKVQGKQKKVPVKRAKKSALPLEEIKVEQSVKENNLKPVPEKRKRPARGKPPPSQEILDISFSSDTSHENDVPLAKLIAANEQKPSEAPVKTEEKIKEKIVQVDVEKLPEPKPKPSKALKAKARKQEGKMKKTKVLAAKKAESLVKPEIIPEEIVNGVIPPEILPTEVPVETKEIEIEVKKVDEQLEPFLAKTSSTNDLITALTIEEKKPFDPFTINEDSFFNDDLDNDPSDKINDIVNNIINSSEFQIDSDTERSEVYHSAQEDLESNPKMSSCTICKKTFRSKNGFEKHCLTTTHVLKVQRKNRGIAKTKERETLKIQEPELIIEKAPSPILDETKVFRTKGALKTFDNILDLPIMVELEKQKPKPVEALKVPVKFNEPSLKIDLSHDPKPPQGNDDKLYYEFKMEKRPEDMTPKDKDQLFDSLFSSLEPKNLEKQIVYTPKSNFSTATPEDSEMESSSASWDVKQDADIEWTGDDADNVPFATAIQERYPKKFPVKINKLKDTAVSIPTKSLIMEKIFKKQKDREKQKTPQADAPNNKPGIKNSLDEIFDHLKNSAEIDDKVLTCPSPKTLLKSAGGTFSPNSSHSNDMLETASQSNNNNIYKSKAPVQLTPAKMEKKPDRPIESRLLFNELMDDEGDDGTGQRKSRRRCAIKTKTFAETWSSDEYEELHDTEDIISIINEIEKRELIKKRKMLRTESVVETVKKPDMIRESPVKFDTIVKPIAPVKESSIVMEHLPREKLEKKKASQTHCEEKVQKLEKSSSAISKRRASVSKEGHKSDEETFTATKVFKPLTTGASIKKRRMSCFVPSTIFDEKPEPKSAPVKHSKEISKVESESLKKFDKLHESVEKTKPSSVKKADSEKSFKNQKKFANLLNSFGGQQSSKKKAQKHRKRPRNKVKNMAYDSDSDFELNLSKKSRAPSAVSESSSSEENDDEDNVNAIVTPKPSKITSTAKTSNLNDMTMIKEPKLLPNDLKHVVPSTTTFKAAIPEDIIDSSQSACNRTKRHSSEKLYYWSSSSSESDQEQGDTAGGGKEDTVAVPHQPEQHGWIVGDSHKKLVTLLAHAKIKNKIN